MHELADRLATIEARLNRSVADGWRHGAADRQIFAAEADQVEQSGLTAFANRLRAVADAQDPRSGLEATTLALAASRMLRARLSLSGQETRWSPWVVPRKGRAAERESLWPLCRFSLGETVVWSCLRARNYPVEWVFLEETPELQLESPWFGAPLTGQLQWRGRYPVGAKREIQVFALDGATQMAGATEPDTFQAIRRRLSVGKLKDDKLPAWGGGSVRLARLEEEHLEGCFWFDPDVRRDIAALVAESCWILIWEPGDVRVVVSAVVERGRIFKALHCVSLTLGCESIELSNLG